VKRHPFNNPNYILRSNISLYKFYFWR